MQNSQPVKSNVQESIKRKLNADVREWALNEKYWLSYLALTTHLASREAEDNAPPQHLMEVETLLSDAIRDLPLDQADEAFEEIDDQCFRHSAGAWCSQMLTRIANQRPESYWIPFIQAYSASRMNLAGARLALQLLERAEHNLGRVEEERQQEQQAWLAFTRGLAHRTLADLADVEADDEIDKAIQYFEKAIHLSEELRKGQNGDMRPGPDPDMTYGELADVLIMKHDIHRAEEIINEGLKLSPKSTFLLRLRGLMLQLRGQFDEALKLYIAKIDKSDEDSLYLRCLSRMFGREPIDARALKKDMDDFLASSHSRRDYVRLIYYWTLMHEGKSYDAEKLLKDRW